MRNSDREYRGRYSAEMKPVNAKVPAKKGLESFEWLPGRNCFLPARAEKLVSKSSPKLVSPRRRGRLELEARCEVGFQNDPTAMPMPGSEKLT